MPKHQLSVTAGALAINAVPTCRANDTAETVRVYIQKNAHSFVSVDYIYVLENHSLVGVFSLHELLTEKPATIVELLMTKEVAYAHTLTDREHVAQIAFAQSIKAVPVVDENNRFAGVVTSDQILQILNEAHTNYLFKAVGMRARHAAGYRELSLFQQVRARTPWLIIGLLGGFIGAFIVKYFEQSLSHQLFVAAFIPAIVYIADAIGNQSEMLVVRALGRDRNFSIRHYLTRELVAGLLISVLLAALMFGLSYWWQKDILLSLTLMLAVVGTTIFSVVFTVVLPWLLKRSGFDPAVAGGPLATVICDVSSVTIYLVIAAAFL